MNDPHDGAMPEPVEFRYYPEMRAGGYSRQDHRMQYVVRVSALLEPHMVVLDFGAGRGKWAEDPVALRRRLGDFRGRCARVIGTDPDPAVLANPQLDAAMVVAPGQPIALPDSSVDLVTAFSVLEHVAEAERTAADLARILRPGGWLCAWTPNRWGYVGVGGRLVPERLRGALLRRLEPRRQESDSFPAYYRMNTGRALRRLFPEPGFLHRSFTVDGQPFYTLDSAVVGRAWRTLFWALPPALKGFHMVFIQKAGRAC